MNYWLINGIGIEAVRLPTALHKFGQHLERTADLKIQKSGRIEWKKIDKKAFIATRRR